MVLFVPRRALALGVCLLGSACHYDDTNTAPDAAIPVLPSEAELLASRPYIFLKPDGYTDAGSYPLMLALHGYGGNNKDFVSRFSLKDFAAQRSVFIAVPNGTLDSRGNLSWNASPVHWPEWDVEYLAAIIHSVEANYPVDPTQVFVFGHSQGGHMTHRMGCDDSADVVALASLAGQAYPHPSECAPTHLVSAVEIHGIEDEVIGYYGDVQNDPPDPNIPSAAQTIGVWGRNDRCTGKLALTGQTKDLSDGVDGAETDVSAFSGCPAGIGVELWSMNGVGHWPYPVPDFMDQVVDFLVAHPRADAGL